nr:hypothetical protein [Nannocystis sp.]
MLRNRLPAVRLVSPLLAISLLLPGSAWAQEALQVGPVVAAPEGPLPQPVPGQTPTTTQTQGPGVQSQLTPGGPQTQTQVQPLPGGPLPMNPGSINMAPQIQVLVQPQIQISAQPKGDASPQTNADANINTNTTPTITNTTTESIVARPYTPPQHYSPPQVYVPAPVITRVIAAPQSYKPYKQLKPLPRRKGLMITGWIVLTVSYLLTASNAADLYDRCPGMNDPKRCRELSRDMFIPVAGPFMAMQHTKWATDDYSLAVAGSLQGAGALMGIIGTAMFIRDGQRNRIINEYGVRVGNDNVRLRTAGTGLSLRAQF